MRSLGRLITAMLLPALLVACGETAVPPGRWQGTLFDGEWMVAVRLEARPDNVVRMSAPNLHSDYARMSLGERIAAFHRVAAELDRGWAEAAPWRVERSGDEIRREGGYSVLFEYEPAGDRMIFHFYSDGTLTHRIPLERVAEFGPPPLPGNL